MDFDAMAEAEALLKQLAPSGESEAGTVQQLERALQAAYSAGRSSVQLGPDEPTLEVIFFRELMELLPDHVYFKDENSRFIANNPAHAKNLGADSPAELQGKSDFDFFEEPFAQQKFEDEQEIIRTGKGWDPKIEHNLHSSGEERWALSTKHPWRDASGKIRGTFGHSHDITAAVLAERALAEQHRLLQTLINVLPCRIFVRDRDHRFRLINEEYRRALQIETNEDIVGKRFRDFIPVEESDRIDDEDDTIMRTGVPVIRRVEYDNSPILPDRWSSVSKVPLRGGDGVIEGIVGVAFDITAEKEAEARVRAAGKELADKNRQIERELALARKLQRALATFQFPEKIEFPGGRSAIASYLYEPSEHLAGDFFQVLQIDAYRFGAFICDVMGHGVRSALVTAVVRGLIEEHRRQLLEPGVLFQRLNHVLFNLAEDPDFPRFVTATYALFDTESETLKIVSAGHPEIFSISPHLPSNPVQALEVEGNPALGLFEDFEFSVAEFPLCEKSTYLLYTDGLTEQPGPEGEEFGEDRLRRILTPSNLETPATLLKALRAELTRFAGTGNFTDDVCAMAIAMR